MNTAAAQDSAYSQLSELAALAGLPFALQWESSLMVVSISAFLLAKAAWYSGKAISDCVEAWARGRRRRR